MASLAAACVGVQVGSAIVATRFVIDQTHPGSLAFLRYSIGAVCLLLPLLASARVPFSKRDLLPLSLLGIIQFGVVVALLNYALQYIPSARAAIIFATVPFQTMVFATVFNYERLTFPKIFGVILTIIGVGFVLGERVLQAGNTQGWLGDIAVFISASSAAVCSVLYRPYLQRYPTLQISSFAMFASVVFLAFLAAGENFFTAFPRFTSEGWVAVFFIGISSGIGYYLWLWALNNTSPTKVTIFLALNPITAAGLGAFFLGENITVTLLIGIVCVVLGLVAAHLDGSQKSPAVSPSD
ncbi:MAG: EamA family transporter [Chloroflexi bacterium]|nr:EamA family transporter [Chloroflexota bacterium]MBI5714716.1 EamA family transporter [Chloroflexota bacterium]